MQNWMRDCAAALGAVRAERSDRLAGGLNTYAYVGGNPNQQH